MKPLSFQLAKIWLCAALAFTVLTAAKAQEKEPKVGEVAPPISAAEWLQGDAVGGFQKGTVYVIEFWATWCGSCHKAQPHLDELSKKMAGKVVFVNISNEEKGIVSSFLAKRPMATRVAVDNKGATVKSYGIHVFPHTVIVDREGKIAATTRPDEVTEAALADVVAGKKIDLPVKSNKSANTDWDTELAGVKTITSQSVGHAIIQRSDADGSAFMFDPRSGRITGDGVDFQSIVQAAYDSRFESTKMNIANPDLGPFRVSVKAPDGKIETARIMLRELIQHNFSFKAEWQEVEKEMVVLRFDASKGNGKFVKSTAAQGFGVSRHGFIKETKIDIKRIVAELGEVGFGQSVIDETGLTGDYDLDMKWNTGDPAAFEKALTELGFSFTREKRKTKILVVDPA